MNWLHYLALCLVHVAIVIGNLTISIACTPTNYNCKCLQDLVKNSGEAVSNSLHGPPIICSFRKTEENAIYDVKNNKSRIKSALFLARLCSRLAQRKDKIYLLVWEKH